MAGAPTLPRPGREHDDDGIGPSGDGHRRSLILLGPAFVVLVTGVVLGIFGGGYSRSVWSTVALFMLALLVLVLVVAAPRRSDRSKLFDAALVAFGLFTLWNYASILWADVPGDAWEGANRTLLYLIGFALVGMFPWPVRAARAALALVGLGLAAVSVGVLVVTELSGDTPGLFVGGRLSEPVGYANALATLWLIGFWPALHLAAAREGHWALRGAGLAAATILLETSLLSQSRGSAISFAIVALVFPLLHPRHWAALAATAVPLVLMALSWNILTEVRLVADSAALDEGLADAYRAIAISAVVAFVVGVVAVLAARRSVGREGLSTTARRRSDQAFLGLAGIAAIALVVVAASSTGWLDDRWEEFRSSSYAQVEEGENRFTGSLGSGRYDYYRVALDEFSAHPVGGIGAENFAVPYLQERRTVEAPRYVHSFGFGLLVHLGIVGTLLFAVFFGLLMAGFARVLTRGSVPERGAAVGAFAGALVWIVHGMADWLWEYPSLTLLGLGLLAIAMRVGDVPAWLGGPAPGRAQRPLVQRALLALAILVAGLVFAVPGTAARYENAAFDVQRTNPEQALARLDRAADLDPLSADALLGRALLARNLGRRDEARADLLEALEREPVNWFAHLELALLAAQAKNWSEADRGVRRAQELNPRQPVLAEVAAIVADRRAVDPRRVEAALSGQLTGRLQPFGE